MKLSQRTRLPRNGWLLIAAAIVVLLLALARWYGQPVRLAVTGQIPATQQRDGDPQQGLQHLLSAPYLDCGIPLRIYQRLGASASPDALRLPGRRGVAAELPYYLNVVDDKHGVPVAANNCLLCHAAPLFGDVLIGLGNEFVDFTAAADTLVERAGLLVESPAEERSWRFFADRIAAITPYTRSHTIGANVANNMTFALMAHREPATLRWSAEPLIKPPPTDPLPVSVPPWWHMAKKNAMFTLGEGRGDHARIMLSAALLCADEQQQFADNDARYAADIRAYIASLRAPAWPFAVDAKLAQAGAAVYRRECAECHGEAAAAPADRSDTGSYPNLVIALDAVGTDPHLALEQVDGDRRFVRWFNRSWFGETATASPARGYVAPPLDGIWATAPYLHNGSVPTLAHLLNSGSRPDFWRWRGNTRSVDNYSVDEIGWSYEKLTAGKSAQRPRNENIHIYDTSKRGYSNAGHTYGDELSAQQRRQLLEFLKTL